MPKKSILLYGIVFYLAIEEGAKLKPAGKLAAGIAENLMQKIIYRNQEADVLS